MVLLKGYGIPGTVREEELVPMPVAVTPRRTLTAETVPLNTQLMKTRELLDEQLRVIVPPSVILLEELVNKVVPDELSPSMMKTDND